MIKIKIDTEKLKIWKFWKYQRALRNIEDVEVPPNDASGQCLQDTIYNCVDISREALG